MQKNNNYFVTPDENLLNGALSADDKNIITKAVTTIDNWQSMCEHDISIALVNNSDMISLKITNNDLKSPTDRLKLKLSTLQRRFYD